MRVGANVRQYARIKRLHADGTPPPAIAKMIQMTEQSLEKILAHLDGRDEVILAVEENEEVQSLRLANAELAARLAKFEDDGNGEKETEDRGPEGEGGNTESVSGVSSPSGEEESKEESAEIKEE
jgi:hypothetical protein